MNETANKRLKLDFVQTSIHDDSVSKFSITYDKKHKKLISKDLPKQMQQ